jgi:hypothetical protein
MATTIDSHGDRVLPDLFLGDLVVAKGRCGFTVTELERLVRASC